MVNATLAVPLRGHTRRDRISRSWKRYWQLYLLMVIPLLDVLVFKYVPMMNVVIAFKDFNPTKGVWGSEWVGFDHFERFFKNPVLPQLIKNTLWLSFYRLIAGFPLAIILAIALNEIRLRWFKRSVQIITYAPFFISTVVLVSMISLVFAPRIGIANDAFDMLGMGPMNVMAKPTSFRHIYVWSDIWQTTGYSAVIYMAALAGIDPGLHEAARIDGASRLQRIRNVDFPGITPTIVVVLILAVGSMMSIGFEKAFLLQNPLNLSQSEIIATYTYKIGLLNADFSLGTAIGLVNSLINLGLLLIVNVVAKRLSGSGLW